MAQSDPQEQPTSVGEAAVAGCERQHRALCECHRRFGDSFQRDFACRHVNRALALCIVSTCCPAESDAVRELCASGGTKLKREQCQRAQVDLSACLSSHQDQV
ncbi:hypothetical protein H6P81_019082 [Aristolochia fimbriata]|uniref:COX assembly mitochondrial protein n=1 Tax=Aristolochia fimbriata TaxID=158543 RepID=A0AAV7DTX5_ARIFI|nr:hypothetical protein H6P81_019082 [Aristolochia fimbriata]